MFNKNRIKALEARICIAEREKELAKQREKEAYRQREEVQKLEAEVRCELDKIRKLVRDQTEADLLINALKAIGIIKETDENKTQQNYHDFHTLLLARQQYMMQGTEQPFVGITGTIGNALGL